MLLGCAIWLGNPADDYLRSINVFIRLHKTAAEGLQLNIYYRAQCYNLPEQFESIYNTSLQKVLRENSEATPEKSLVDYNEMIKLINFIDIDAESGFANDPYIAWLMQFEPTPFIYISDYLRYLILEYLSAQNDHQADILIFFELDAYFTSALPFTALQKGTLYDRIEEMEAHYMIILSQPNAACHALLTMIVEAYRCLAEKILYRFPISLKELGNQSIVAGDIEAITRAIYQNNSSTSSYTFAFEKQVERKIYGAMRHYLIAFHGCIHEIPRYIYELYKADEKACPVVNHKDWLEEFCIHNSGSKSSTRYTLKDKAQSSLLTKVGHFERNNSSSSDSAKEPEKDTANTIDESTYNCLSLK